jgi:hypothetical protein
VALCLAIVAGCASPSTNPSTAASSQPGGSVVASSSVQPSEGEDPALSGEPTSEVSSEPSVEPTTSVEPSAEPAAPCAGSDENRDFFVEAAHAVEWPVYCAVLPQGWVVETGSYRLANGGKLEIAYRNRSGARLELHEGAFCADGDVCALDGADRGPASFGDRPGTLVLAGDGSWAVTVDHGEPISWLAIGRGFDEATFRDTAAALVRVGD